MTAVSVIVPARNAASTLGDTLAALAAQRLDAAYEVIVVDDGSSDETAAIAGAARVELVSADGVGPGPARNAGAARARGGLLAFTDADCVPRPDWLDAGLQALADADLVQGSVVPDPEAPRSPFDRTISVRREYGLYETASLFVRGELFERLGGFEDPIGARVGKPLGEDVWFGWRARRAGARVAFSEGAIVEHAVFPRSRSEFVGERLRLVYFPVMVALMPELRDTFLWRRWFLNRRTAMFTAGIAGTLAAIAAAAISGAAAVLALALVAWLPYLSVAIGQARGWGRRAVDVLVTGAVADTVGFGALVVGSVRSGAPVF